MAETSQTTPENEGKKQKKLASKLPVDGDAKSLVSSLANEVGQGEKTQSAPSLHQTAAIKILGILDGMTVMDGELTLDIVKAWLPQTSCVELAQVNTLIRRIVSHPSIT